MDYAKLCFASEARTLALGLASKAAPKEFSPEQQSEFVRENFRKYLALAISEIEFTAHAIAEIKAGESS